MFSDSKVLLIGTKTFGISKRIQEEIVNQYGNCYFIDERLGLNGLLLAPFKLFPFLAILLAPIYLLHIQKIKNLDVNKILVLRGEFFPLWYAKWLNKSCEDVVYYTWDSFSNYPRMRSVANCFSQRYTFDFEDAKGDLLYKALFMMGKKLQNSSKDIDIFFFGTYHSDRLIIANSLLSKQPDLRVHVFLYHQYPWIQILLDSIKTGRWLFKYRKLISNVSLSHNDLNDYIKRSHCLLDVHHPGQSGLTLRMFDALRGNCKVISTNENVLKEEAFDYSNSFITNRELSRFPRLDWIRDSDGLYEECVFEYYSLESWVKSILS